MLRKLKKCPKCLGLGRCDDGSVCDACTGTGEVASNQDVQVESPCWNLRGEPDPVKS